MIGCRNIFETISNSRVQPATNTNPVEPEPLPNVEPATNSNSVEPEPLPNVQPATNSNSVEPKPLPNVQQLQPAVEPEASRHGASGGTPEADMNTEPPPKKKRARNPLTDFGSKVYCAED